MKSKFSKKWVKSKQVRKQRKYIFNAPLHIKSKFLNAHLSQELRKKHGKRSLRVRTGDKVKVMRGTYKGHESKVERVDVKKEKIYLEKIEVSKKEGSKSKVPFKASNLLITNLNLDDKKRVQKLKLKGEQ
ncbi:MAG: 50S ribosomal protein L24 [Nanoarchaeota archaeon]|nr:50S ribosomal protein L24 [Nanoarchaeota archaeon]MBU1269138.1 50S ribosomal protein L24 [Nanoarchaeota archaeon]MBU1605100.1 50S ribosomal protein L24 [Nanoarchaeota archaeon]MBU2442781.1 50S ribosomal protein L24 [Nanoarchaeota archaeon]